MRFKKILIVILFCISSFFTTLEVKNKELSDNWYPHTNFEETTVILEADHTINAVEALDMFMEAVKRNNVSAMIQRADYYGGSYDYYVYSPNTNVVEKVPIIMDTEIDFSQYQTLEFYSSFPNKESSGRIFAYYPIIFSDFRIMNFKPVYDKPNLIYGWTSIVGDKQDVDRTLKELENYFGESLIITEDGIQDLEKGKVDFRPFIITLILLVVVMLQFLSDKFKEISIRKTLGESHLSIILNVFRKDVIRLFVLSIVTYSVLYMLFIRTLNVYTIPLIKDLFKYSFILLILLIISVLTIYLFLTTLPPTAFIKNKTFNEKLYAINYILKVVLVIILMPSVINTSQELSKEFEWKSYLDQYYPVAQKGTSLISRTFEKNLMSEEKLVEIENDFKSLDHTFAYLEDTFGIGDDYQSYYHIEEGYLDSIGLGYLELSQDKPTVLIPKGYTKEKLKGVCDDCEFVELTDDYRFYIFGVLQEMEYDNIVLVSYPKRELLEDKYTPLHYMNIAGSEEEAAAVAEYMNNQYGHFVTYGGQPMSFYLLLLETNSKIRNIGIELIEILLILLFVLYNGVSSLYELSRKKMSLYYTLGRTKLYRMKELIIQDFFLVGLLMVYLFSKGFPIQIVLLSNCLVVIADMLIAVYLIHRNERKNLTQSLKK